MFSLQGPIKLLNGLKYLLILVLKVALLDNEPALPKYTPIILLLCENLMPNSYKPIFYGINYYTSLNFLLLHYIH